MSIKTKLAELNELHVSLGRGTFKSWKKSEALIDKKIAEAKKEIIARDPEAQEKKDLLVRLNDYRKAMGIKQATEWKGDANSLRSAITSIKADHLAMIKSEEAAKPKKGVKIPSLAKTMKPTKKAKAAKTITVKTEVALLPGIANELGINPKVARQKLRKKFGSEWRNLPAKDIREVLKGA